jgi:hypothetical protein
MVSKVDFKDLFQSYLKYMLTKKGKQTKKKDNMDIDDESLDMNDFEKSWKVRKLKFQSQRRIGYEQHEF